MEQKNEKLYRWTFRFEKFLKDMEKFIEDKEDEEWAKDIDGVSVLKNSKYGITFIHAYGVCKEWCDIEEV